MTFRLKFIFVYLEALPVGTVCMTVYLITSQRFRQVIKFVAAAWVTNKTKIYSKRKFPILQYS